MLNRTALGAMVVALILALVGADALLARQVPGGIALFGQGGPIPLVLAGLSAIAALELASLCRRRNLHPYVGWASICCIVLVLAPWLSASGMLGHSPSAVEAVGLQLLLTALAALGAGIVGVLRKDVEQGLGNVAATTLVIGYAGLLPSFLTLLRCDVNRVGEHGAWILLTVMLVCKVSDIGAYFLGTLFGRHRLIPAVSPKKSVEGFVGGILASCAVSLAFWFGHQAAVPTENTLEGQAIRDHSIQLLHIATIMYAPLGLVQAIIFGAVMSIVGQLGDLVESVFKRSADVKDSGTVLPGFGGILDMIDSPIAVAPVAWLLLTKIWGV